MMSVDDVMDILAIPLMGTIPDDEAIVISTNQGGTSGRYEYAIRTKHIWTSAGGSWGGDPYVCTAAEPDFLHGFQDF